MLPPAPHTAAGAVSISEGLPGAAGGAGAGTTLGTSDTAREAEGAVTRPGLCSSGEKWPGTARRLGSSEDSHVRAWDGV